MERKKADDSDNYKIWFESQPKTYIQRAVKEYLKVRGRRGLNHKAPYGRVYRIDLDSSLVIPQGPTAGFNPGPVPRKVCPWCKRPL